MGSRSFSWGFLLTYLLVLAWNAGLFDLFQVETGRILSLDIIQVWSHSLPQLLTGFLLYLPMGILLELVFRTASWLHNLVLTGLVASFLACVTYLCKGQLVGLDFLLFQGFGAAIGINVAYVATSVWREKAYSRLHLVFLLGFLVFFGTVLLKEYWQEIGFLLE
ncbi:TPA: hypothetical protein TXJ16_001381 [Streptococcus suis]|nr:hypothetical protein [Streptococcus suis]